MRLVRSLLLLLLSPAGLCSAQEAQPAPQKPSTLLQSALARVAQAGSAVDLNRWKGSNALRDEVDANLASMQKDLQATLPPLLDAADAAPDSAAAALPVLLNLDALYSVLLRVSIAAHSGAPRDQNTDLEQAATVLDGARRDLGDTILAMVRAQEKHAADLRAAMQQAAPPPVAVEPPAAAPAKTKKRAAAARSAAPH